MTFNPTKLFFFFFFLPFLTQFSSSNSNSNSNSNFNSKYTNNNITVYEILPKYGLPSGLLPNSVTSYTLSEQDGKFEVHLKKPCYIKFDYLVYYDKKITGKLKMGSITSLKGIQVQRFYVMWFNVDEIKVDLPPSHTIYFTVGIINKKLDLGQFLTVRSCKDKAFTLDQKTVSLVDDNPMMVSEE